MKLTILALRRNLVSTDIVNFRSECVALNGQEGNVIELLYCIHTIRNGKRLYINK